MATDRQIEANRQNAGRSTGPTSEAGKARSRLNATKHGMSGTSGVIEAGASVEFEERRARWASGKGPLDEAGGWALDRAVAASFRIERCERSLDRLATVDQARAIMAWDQDRAAEAAILAARLGKEPNLVTKVLETSRSGVEWLLEAWIGLFATIESGDDWTELQASRALDLLGVPTENRRGATPIDTVAGADLLDFRKRLVVEEMVRLEEILDEVMIPLDQMNREVAMSGDLALLTKPSKLVLRYERDAWRRYREAMAEVQAPPPEEAPPESDLPVKSAQARAAVAKPSESEQPAEAEEDRAFDEERRSLLEHAAPILAMVRDRVAANDPDFAWFEDLDRRMEAEDLAMFAADGDETNPIWPPRG